MSKSSLVFNPIFSKTFSKQLTKIRDKLRITRIKQKTDEIIIQPYRNIEFGAGAYRGKRKDRIGEDRIIFTVCKQCRIEGHIKYNNCDNCNLIPDETVRFWEIVEGHKY